MGERDRQVLINESQMIIRFLEGESRVERSKHLSQKLIPRDELEGLGNFLKRRSLRVAYTSGAFDVIHKGHARYLNLARSLGDVLVVGLNSDKSIQGYKGPDRPILHEDDRAEMLSFLEAIDYITIYDEPAGGEVIKLLKPHSYLCVEGSWEGDIATKEEVIAMANVNGEVYYTPRQDPFQSTSDIIAKIGEKYGKQAYEDYKKMMEAANGK